MQSLKHSFYGQRGPRKGLLLTLTQGLPESGEEPAPKAEAALQGWNGCPGPQGAGPRAPPTLASLLSVPGFFGCAPRLQRMIPVPQPRKGGKWISKSALLRPRGCTWETVQGNTMGRGSAEPGALNHLTLACEPRVWVTVPNHHDCNQLEASCIQQSRQKHAI